MRTHRFRSHNTRTCGLHVHLNRGQTRGRRLGEPTEVKITHFVNRHQSLFEQLARRNSGQWSQFVHKPLRKGENCNNDRYEAINFTGRTMEFRLFRGTLKLSTLYATLELVDAIARFCLMYSAARMVDATQARADFLQFTQSNGYEYLPTYMVERRIPECV